MTINNNQNKLSFSAAKKFHNANTEDTQGISQKQNGKMPIPERKTKILVCPIHLFKTLISRKQKSWGPTSKIKEVNNFFLKKSFVLTLAPLPAFVSLYPSLHLNIKAENKTKTTKECHLFRIRTTMGKKNQILPCSTLVHTYHDF